MSETDITQIGGCEKEISQCSNKSRHGVGVIEIKANQGGWKECDDNRNNQQETPFLRSEVHHMYQSYPFGFRTPENCSNSICRWIYPITFGGGLVGGDQIETNFIIGEKCCVTVCTQETTKVYHCRQTDKTTTQVMDYIVNEESLLCVLPDPLVCYKDAVFEQKQTFHLCPSSNLLFLDWLQAGRKALGEWWQFQRYCNNIELFISDTLVFHECNELESTPLVALDKCMGKYEFYGTCIILGPYLSTLSKALEEKYGCKNGFGEKLSDDLKVSVSPLSYAVGGEQLDGCYIRFLATHMEAAAIFIKDITTPLLYELGAYPFERKL